MCFKLRTSCPTICSQLQQHNEDLRGTGAEFRSSLLGSVIRLMFVSEICPQGATDL